MPDDRRPAYAAATPADRAWVVALLRSCHLPGDDLPVTLEHFFVARTEDQPLGVIGLELLGERALVRSLAVFPQCRGNGVAHHLWRLAQTRARQLGVRELYCLTTTAEAMFAHWGFHKISRDQAPDDIRQTPEWKTLCPESAASMRLRL
jgi:amino-acid N-acetyltransferase